MTTEADTEGPSTRCGRREMHRCRGRARKRRQDSTSEVGYARYASMTLGGSRERACTGMQRNAVLRFVPVSDAFSFMNVLRPDICARKSKQEVQFSEALMFKRYQCRKRFPDFTTSRSLTLRMRAASLRISYSSGFFRHNGAWKERSVLNSGSESVRH